MEGDYAATQNANGENDGTEYAYPEGYSDADYYYPQQKEGDRGEEHYASYQQGGYDEYYSQQEGGQEGADPYQYPSSYDTNAGGPYDVANSAEGQEYNYYTTGEEGYEQQQMYPTKTPETWSYGLEGGQHLYLDQLTTEQAAGYYYDEEGNLIDGYGERESPTNVFSQETYWESGQDGNNLPFAEDATSSATRDGSPQDEADTESLGLTESTPLASATTEDAKDNPPRKIEKKDNNGRAASPSRKKKTKKERIAERQALLEKEEEERLKAQEAVEAAGANDNVPTAATKMSRLPKKKTGFVDRERAKFHMKLRIAKAIKRNRMPVQIRILPTTRKHLAPMEEYFGSKSVECVLSDIFWASMKGDIGRVKHLVQVEGESPTDICISSDARSRFASNNCHQLHQTPLHWAAKGGSVPVINYFLAAGANPRCLDENGSLPLHLSCWAGHVDASIVLLRGSDVKDLYVQDYDGALCPLDWVNARGHTKLLTAIEKDSLWLPKFVDDLIRGIVRYKIEVFKDPPKKPAAKDVPAGAATDKPADQTAESLATDTANATKPSPAKKSLLKRAKTEKANRKLEKEDKAASSKSLG